MHRRQIVLGGLTAAVVAIVAALSIFSASAAPSSVTYPGNPVVLMDITGNLLGGVASGVTNIANPIIVGGVDSSGDARQLSTDTSGDLNVNLLALNKLLDSIAAQPGAQYQSQVTTSVSASPTTVTYNTIQLAGDTTDKAIYDALSASICLLNNTNATITASNLILSDNFGGQTLNNTIAANGAVSIAASSSTPACLTYTIPPNKLLKVVTATFTGPTSGTINSGIVFSSHPLDAGTSVAYAPPFRLTDGTNTLATTTHAAIVGGSNGGALATDSSNDVVIVGTTAAGSAPTGNPAMVGGKDAAGNAQFVNMDTSGNVGTVGAVKTISLGFTSPSTVTTVAETTVTGLGIYRSMSCYASLQGGTGGTLDIYIQGTPDAGTTWVDYAHYAQQAAGAGANNNFFSVTRAQQVTTINTSIGTGTNPALAASTVLGGDWGSQLRTVAKTGSGTTAGAVQTIKCSLAG